MESKNPCDGRVIAFDDVVAPGLFDLPEAMKMWVSPASRASATKRQRP